MALKLIQKLKSSPEKEIALSNPFAELLNKEYKSREGKDILVIEYEVQELMTQGIREFLSPRLHSKNKKSGHRDLRNNGSVQNMMILWRKITTSDVLPGDPFEKKGTKFNRTNSQNSKKAK